jgi:hypothetical protein
MSRIIYGNSLRPPSLNTISFQIYIKDDFASPPVYAVFAFLKKPGILASINTVLANWSSFSRF